LAAKRGPKYKTDPNLFETLDEKKAWFLGFFCADGCVVSDRLITFSQSGDQGREMMEWILHNIFDVRNYPLVGRETGKQRSYAVTLTAPSIIKILKRYGITEKKSLTLAFDFSQLDSFELRRAFIRGYIEGDGCIAIVPGKSKLFRYLALDIVGTTQVMKNIQKILKEDFGIEPSIHPLKSIFNIRIQNRNTPELIRRIYEENTQEIYKGRKYKIYSNYVEENPIQHKQQIRDSHLYKIQQGMIDYPEITLNALAKKIDIGFSILYRYRERGLI
jgi:hypothetical protein